jgi:hypothetical protein
MVELSNPRMVGGKLSFDVRVLEGGPYQGERAGRGFAERLGTSLNLI